MAGEAIREEIQEIVEVYRQRVLRERTRQVRLYGRKCSPRLLRTFLGIELQMGGKRITCPDLTTARYLKIFGELGLKQVRIPYDPTVTAQLLPVLEASHQRIKDRLERDASDEAERRRSEVRIFRRIRRQLEP
jgi:hypothetical protein